MSALLISGGSGFFGEILSNHFLERGYDCVNIDLQPDHRKHPRLTSIQGDICDEALLESVGRRQSFTAVLHCAALLAHDSGQRHLLWRSNVDGTRRICEFARRFKIPKMVFISSNCLWADGFGRRVLEEDLPRPVEIYGRSKWEGEKIIGEFKDSFDSVILRSPTIMDSGRLGLLSILFEFIEEGRKVWVVGEGSNRYQFIYAKDLVQAIESSLDKTSGFQLFNVGSDHVKPLRQIYQAVIDQARTGARVASLPKTPALLGMKLCHHLGLSPLGPYHYRMIAEDFQFETARIKTALQWQPTLTNEQMLWKAYESYAENKKSPRDKSTRLSAHKRPVKLGVIKLLKAIS